MMKKEYIAPEMIVNHVIFEKFMDLSGEIGDDPTPGIGWGQQEAKDGETWPDHSNDIWED